MKIALSLNGLYVCAEQGGDDQGIVHVNRPAIGPWETWTSERVGDRYAFRSANGRYLSAELGGGGDVHANRKSIGPWEHFTLGLHGRDGVTFGCLDGQHYLSVDGNAPDQPLDARSTSPVPFTLTTLEPDVPPLTIQGRKFSRFLCGTDQFRAYERYRNGEDLSALYQESKDLGVWVWRVFTMALWTVHPDQDDLSQLAPFVDDLNAHGIVPHLEVLADCGVLLPARADRQRRWTDIADRVRGKSVLLSMGNEFDKNQFDPGELADLGDSVIWSRGSATGDRACYRPEGRFNCFHPRRDLPKMLDDSVASAMFLQYTYGLQGPLVMDEGIGFCSRNEPGRRSNDPDLARRLAGHYALEWAGAYFHNEGGMSSVVMDDQTRRCAEAWAQMIHALTP